MKAETFFKPEQIMRINNISIRAKHIVEGMIAGIHRSPYHGFSSEFMEYRRYQNGEHSGLIDWRKYAKTEKAVIRLFEDETNLYARLLLDKSSSMKMSSQKNGVSKFDYAVTLSAALAWILIKERDAVGISCFSSSIEKVIGPKSTNAHLKTILSVLDTITPGGETGLGRSINSISNTIKKRGMAVLVSDLLDDPEEIVNGIRHLRFKKQDVIVIRVLDPIELNFLEGHILKLRDSETGRKLSIDGGSARQHYLKKFKEHYQKISRAMIDLGVDMLTVTTEEPFAKALLRIVDKRRRLF